MTRARIDVPSRCEDDEDATARGSALVIAVSGGSVLSSGIIGTAVEIG